VLFQPVIRELSFTHQGNRLVGDLVLPPGPGPHPGVVFVKGPDRAIVIKVVADETGRRRLCQPGL
jgi:hypothetical protein